jgi:uncharacterized protein
MTPEEKAEKGLGLLKESILDFLKQHPDGATNAQVNNALDLHSEQAGKQKNYLSWSILGILMREGKVARKRAVYHLS